MTNEQRSPKACVSVIGVDLGTAKSGLCGIVDGRVQLLEVVPPDDLAAKFAEFARAHGNPQEVVVDAPIAPEGVGATGFRSVDRVFMRGLFNNNHVGLQPNNPALLDLAPPLAVLSASCASMGLRYSNAFPETAPCIRETHPNAALGVLSDPNELKRVKRTLRFRYGRGDNVAPIVVAFEALVGSVVPLLEPLTAGAPLTWELVECHGLEAGSQGDDIVAALTCACLAWQEASGASVGYVSDTGGHYLLPPRDMAHASWVIELRRIIEESGFDGLTSGW